jgi:hypothetical protein
MVNSPVRKGLSYLSVGLLAAGSLAFAQDAQQYPTATTNNNQQSTTNSTGGWKRVGDSGTSNPNTAQNYPAYSDQAPMPDQNSAPMQPAPSAQPYAQSGQSGYYSTPAQQSGAYAPQPAPYPQQAPYAQPSPYAQQAPYAQPSPYAQQAPYNNYPQYGQQPPQTGYGQQGYGYNQQQSYAAPPPVTASLTIPQGTYITVRINQLLSSDRNQPGDAFSATLVDPIVVNGIVVAEPGQTVGGHVAVVEKHGVGHPAKLGIEITTLTLVDGQQASVITQLTSRRGGTTPGAVEAGTIIGTTGVGAAIGAAAGWGTGAAIGAGAGALAGIIGTVVTHNHASVITPEQVLTFQLEQPVTVNTTASQAAFRYVQPGEYEQGGSPGPGGPYAGGPYVASAAPAYPAYAYPYPYAYYGYGYPYYWGPSFAFYYGRGWYPYHYYGGYHGYAGYHGAVVVRGRR